MNKTAARLAKMETAFKPCERCKYLEQQVKLFNDALLSLSVKPVEPRSDENRFERCDVCGQSYIVHTAFDTEATLEDLRVFLAEDQRKREAGLPVSRERWQRYIEFWDCMEQRERDFYGADVYDRAIQTTDYPRVRRRMEETMNSAPTEAEIVEQFSHVHRGLTV
ncbi:MAG: hypothetical protein SF097_04645 [Acidobacteriota bacterium]|nr:hypothetical protein [Acidobacteriota bacterium]